MKKNADQKKKEDEERKKRDQLKNRKLANEKKDYEEERLKSCDQDTKKYIMEIFSNNCPKEINPSGIQWVEGTTRLIARRVYESNRIESVCLNRKGISDDEGRALIFAVTHSKSVRKLELEGNDLRTLSLKELINLVTINDTLQYLSLECNTNL